jgi:hypothetical protein
MSELKPALYVTVNDRDGNYLGFEELCLRNNRWIRVSGKADGRKAERPMSYREAREFAVANIKNNNSFLVPKRLPELEFLLEFDLPIILKVDDFDDPWDFDPSDWTLIAHIRDTDVDRVDIDYFDTIEDYLFTADGSWLRVCITKLFVDWDTHRSVTAQILDEKEAAKLLGINGIELPDSLKPFEVVKKLTPGMLLKHLAATLPRIDQIDSQIESNPGGEQVAVEKPLDSTVPIASLGAVDLSSIADKTPSDLRQYFGTMVYSQLAGQQARLFAVLLRTPHFVTFDTLRETYNAADASLKIFRVKNPSDYAVRQAIKRLKDELLDHPFSCNLDGNRVKLEFLLQSTCTTGEGTSNDK